MQACYLCEMKMLVICKHFVTGFIKAADTYSQTLKAVPKSQICPAGFHEQFNGHLVDARQGTQAC